MKTRTPKDWDTEKLVTALRLASITHSLTPNSYPVLYFPRSLAQYEGTSKGGVGMGWERIEIGLRSTGWGM